MVAGQPADSRKPGKELAMKTFLTGAVAALTASAAIVAANPASAEPHGRYHHGGDGAGAAIAGNHHDRYYGGYDYGYGYGPRRVYYYDGPPPSYYAGPSYYTYYERCRTEWRWDPRWDRYVRIRACY
jgi:hypothetical protein